MLQLAPGVTNEELQNHYGETPYLNDRFQAGDFWYKVTGPDTVQLIRDPGSSWSSYPELSGEIIVPAEVTYENTAFRVTSIGEHAFGNNSGITAVTLPDILETIGESAFSGCYALELTYLPVRSAGWTIWPSNIPAVFTAICRPIWRSWVPRYSTEQASRRQSSPSL